MLSNTIWNELLNFPFSHFGPVTCLNDNEFIVLSQKYEQFNDNGDGIYTFNIIKNEWNKIYNYDTNISYNCFWSSAYDNKNKILYGVSCDLKTVDNDSKIFLFHLNSKISTCLLQENKKYYEIIFVNEQLHQIGSIESGNHFCFNNKQKYFQKISTLKKTANLMNFGNIYLPQNKILFIMGGYVPSLTIFQYCNTIWKYSTKTKHWCELKITLPVKLAGFGVVSTKNEQYIIILGGSISLGEGSDNIFIYDIIKNKFMISKIKCPEKAEYQAILFNNSLRDEILTYGYIKNCFKNPMFNNVQLLPTYLVKMIGVYYCLEQIHLIGRKNKHWSINIDCLL